MVSLLFAIALGGAAGAVLRYAVALATRSWLAGAHWFPAPHFPLATFLVNLSGAFLIGLLYQTFQRYPLSEPVRLFLSTGFLGALTTFSTFALEGVNLLRAEQSGTAFAYLLLSNLGGLACAWLGLLAGRQLFPIG